MKIIKNKQRMYNTQRPMYDLSLNSIILWIVYVIDIENMFLFDRFDYYYLFEESSQHFQV